MDGTQTELGRSRTKDDRDLGVLVANHVCVFLKAKEIHVSQSNQKQPVRASRNQMGMDLPGFVGLLDTIHEPHLA